MDKYCVFFHRWGKWGEVQVRKMQTLINGVSLKEPSIEEYQRRVCEDCGKVVERIL